MWRRAAAGGVFPAFVDADTISDSGSSTSLSVPSPPQPRRKQQTHSVLQVVRAGAHSRQGHPNCRRAPAPVAVEEKMTSQVVEGSASSEAADTAINRYLLTDGLIPMTRSEVLDVDLNALAPPPPPGASQPPRPVVLRPVICAYCNCAFCFGADEFPSLVPGPGHVYPAPPVPITLNLLTPPAVWPLHRPDPWGPGTMPEKLLVCSSRHHFSLTMGMLQQQQQPGGAPELVWKWPICLNVRPIVMGSEGSNSSDLHANPAPPPLEPWRYAGAYWNYVLPGHENMVKLKLHDDPLNLTLGRP